MLHLTFWPTGASVSGQVYAYYYLGKKLGACRLIPVACDGHLRYVLQNLQDRFVKCRMMTGPVVKHRAVFPFRPEVESHTLSREAH